MVSLRESRRRGIGDRTKVKFFKVLLQKEAIGVEGIGGKRECVIFKLGQLASREGNSGDDIEKEELSHYVLNKQEGP